MALELCDDCKKKLPFGYDSGRVLVYDPRAGVEVHGLRDLLLAEGMRFVGPEVGSLPEVIEKAQKRFTL